MPRTDTGKIIVDLARQQGQVSPKELMEELQISNVAVHKQLRKLEARKLIYKVGTPPLVYYKPLEVKRKLPSETMYKGLNQTLRVKPIIEKNFIQVKPEGIILYGLEAFEYWYNKQLSKGQKLNIQKTADDYEDILLKYDKFRSPNSLINATPKLHSSFENVFLDELWYLDFYSFERFGKTKLAELTYLAKQTENRQLVAEVVALTKDLIISFVLEKKIDCVGFVPPTASRKIQFMHEFQNYLNLSLPVLNIKKLITPIRIQQKSIKDLYERVDNADKTMVVSDKRKFQNVLLIDDFVGSGSSMNILARKIKQLDVSQQVFGLALTGSLKGFEVINQV